MNNSNGIFALTVTAMGCPTATSLEPSGASILAKYLKQTSQQKQRFIIKTCMFLDKEKLPEQI